MRLPVFRQRRLGRKGEIQRREYLFLYKEITSHSGSDPKRLGFRRGCLQGSELDECATLHPAI